MARTARAGGIAVLMTVLLAGCASTPAAYVPADNQQGGTCDGVAGPPTLSLLPPDAVITDVVVCEVPWGPVSGDGGAEGGTVRRLAADRIPALHAALTLPDESGAGNTCTAIGIVVPAFTVTLADGSRLRPGIPGDGCHPRAEALAALS